MKPSQVIKAASNTLAARLEREHNKKLKQEAKENNANRVSKSSQSADAA